MLQTILLILQIIGAVPQLLGLLKEIIDLFRKAPPVVQSEVKHDLKMALMEHSQEQDISLLSSRLKDIACKLWACT